MFAHFTICPQGLRNGTQKFDIGLGTPQSIGQFVVKFNGIIFFIRTRSFYQSLQCGNARHVFEIVCCLGKNQGKYGGKDRIFHRAKVMGKVGQFLGRLLICR